MTTRVNRFIRSNKAISKGTFALVFKAHPAPDVNERDFADVGLGRDTPVALRVLRVKNSKNKNLREETRGHIYLRDVRHDNLMRFYGCFDEDGHRIFVTEYLDGGTLKQWRVRHDRITEDQIRMIAYNMAQGLQAVHDSDHIHRDVKIENYMLRNGDDLHVKLIDFGMIQESANKPTSFRGTYRCMSPEQVYMLKREDSLTEEQKAVKSHGGKEADVWALGIAVMELIIGRYLYSVCDGHEINYPEHWENVINRRFAVNIDDLKISTAGKNWLKSVLCVDPRKRATVTDALHHKWFGRFQRAAGVLRRTIEIQADYSDIPRSEGAQRQVSDIYHNSKQQLPVPGERSLIPTVNEGALFSPLSKRRLRTSKKQSSPSVTLPSLSRLSNRLEKTRFSPSKKEYRARQSEAMPTSQVGTERPDISPTKKRKCGRLLCGTNRRTYGGRYSSSSIEASTGSQPLRKVHLRGMNNERRSRQGLCNQP